MHLGKQLCLRATLAKSETKFDGVHYLEYQPSAFDRRYHGISSHSTSVLGSPPNLASPSPLHSASVHITSFADFVNPRPSWEFDLPKRTVDRELEEEDLSHVYLSPKKLMELTGESNLNNVTYLEFSINTLENSLGNFGN